MWFRWLGFLETELTKAQAAGCSMVIGFGSSVANSQTAEVATVLQQRTHPGASTWVQIRCEACPEAWSMNGTFEGSLEKPNPP